MARLLLTDLNKFKLNTVCKRLNIKQEHHHRAVDDARVTAEVFLRFVEMLEEQDVHTLAKLNDMGAMSPDLIKKAPSYHGIILVKNETGRINLNRLVSASHLDYFNRRPRMPESLIQKYREGLILGSACEAGELFQAVIRGKSEEELAELVRFMTTSKFSQSVTICSCLKVTGTKRKQLKIYRIITVRLWNLAKDITNRLLRPVMFIS